MPPAAWRVCEYAVPTTPFGSDVVVTVSAGGAMVRLKPALAVCTDEPESVTLKVSGVAVTCALGVPLIKPVDAFSDNPAGKVPAVSCHVKAPVPPVAARLWEYATPTWPLGRDVVVIVNVAGAMVRFKYTVPLRPEAPESVTLNVSGAAVTGVVGVPPISPVEAFSAKPAGKVPAVSCHVKATVPPVAARLWEYATPTWPLGRDVVVIVNVAAAMIRFKFPVAVCAVEAFSAKPAGKVPAVSCHVKAPVPPVAARLWEYATPTWPLGRDVVVIVNVAGAMVRFKFTVAVCAQDPESVTLNVSGVAVTGVVGVPPISPVEAFSAKPAGNVPAVSCHVKAPVPPVAANVCE